MNCPYCQKELTDVSQTTENSGRYIARCYHGNIKITMFYCKAPDEKPLVAWFELSDYMLVLSYIGQNCWLYATDRSERSEYIMHLEYLPDIAPKDTREWIERLLNIKAFS